MNVKPAVLALIAAACVTAAASAAYVAVRQNRAEAPRDVVTSWDNLGVPAPAESSATAPPAVSETEATVADLSPGTSPLPAGDGTMSRPAEAPDPTAARPNVPASARRDAGSAATSRGRSLLAPAPATEPAVSAAGRNGEAAPSNVAPGATRDSATAPTTAGEHSSPEADDTPEPAPSRSEPRFVEVVVPTSAVIGLQIDRGLSSETAHVEDRVAAKVTRDVMAGGRRAIPAGSRMLGSVVLVERGGKLKDQARLGVRFHTLVLADGQELPLRTQAIFREGSSPGNEGSRKIAGAAIGGAILGAILGGGKGAAIGGATGAAGGTAAVMAGGRNPATLPAGTVISAQLVESVTVQVDRE